MTVFSYAGRGGDGSLIEAEMDAGSAEAVASQLRELGITPVRISAVEAKQDAVVDIRKLWAPRSVRIEDLIAFSRQMRTLTKAGVPMIRALLGLSENSRNPMLGQALGDVVEGLRSGRELSDALSLHPKVFSRLFVSIIRVGEGIGKLDDAFEQIGNHLEFERDTRRRIKSATRYPTLVIGAIVIAVVFINIFVIPAFAKLFGAFGAELPWATQLLIKSSNFMVAAWPYLLIGSVLGSAAIRQYLKSARGRYLWDKYRLRMPVVGSIIYRSILARYARTFSMTIGSGVPLINALQIVAQAADNSWVAERIRNMLQNIERGETLTRAAAASGLFTPLVLQMMSVGEETGAVTEIHDEIAESYEGDVDYDLKRVSDLIEPIMIVGVGVVVLVLALGVYLPMWDLSSAARGGR